MRIPHRTHVLSNGLRLLVHEDRTAPIVTTQLVVHVGSARESFGRTGFAHLFEHMMFQGSAQVPEGAFFARVQEAGGTLNANTSADRTLYYTELPADSLELALWLEADRLGWLLAALDRTTLDNQRDVVLEERKQNYEQKPYGGVHEVLSAATFPREHPYSWPTIGSVEDVREATLDDVQDFFRRWYVPNNATLCVGGDIDFDTAVELVERHFGPIPAGPAALRETPVPVRLEVARRLVREDRVPVPQLDLAWPTVPAGHPDAPALELLLQVLSANRSSVLDRAMTVDERLASVLNAMHHPRELAGTLGFALRPHEGVTLDGLLARLLALLEETAERGVSAQELARVRSSYEAALVRNLEKVAARSAALALNDRLRGDPDALDADARARARVTPDEVTDVLRRYLLEQPFAAVSTVPEGERDAALAHSEPVPTTAAPAPRRTLPDLGPWTAPPFGAHAEAERGTTSHAPRLPRSWSAPPAPGAPAPVVSAPGGPLPLVRVRIAIPCGRVRQGPGRFGLASLTAALLREGAGAWDGHAFQEALDAIGARLVTRTGEEDLVLELDVLEEYVYDGARLFAAVLHEPRLAEDDFERLRAERLQALASRAANPASLADDLWRARMHGPETTRGGPPFGSPESVAELTADDVRELWRAQSGPREARVLHAGRLERDALLEALEPIFAPWSDDGRAPRAADPGDPPPPAPRPRAWLREVAGAKQCELRVGQRGLAFTEPDHHPLAVWNHAFGGHFSGRLNRRLREELGLTYGARSSLGGGLRPGAWTASTAVHAEAGARAVLEILSLFRDQYEQGVRAEDLAFVKDSLGKADARRFETLDSRLAYLDDWTRYDIGPEHPLERRARRESFRAADLDEVARRRLDPERMEVLVVGETRETRRALEDAGIECREI